MTPHRTEYMLEVYSDKNLVEHFRSDRPFLKPEVGEFVHSGIFTGWEGPPTILRVDNVVHSVRKLDGGSSIVHQLLVYTHEVSDPPAEIHLTAPYRPYQG